MSSKYLFLLLVCCSFLTSCFLEEKDDTEVKSLVITLFPPTVEMGQCIPFNVEAINHDRQPTNPEEDLTIVYTAEIGGFYSDATCQTSTTSSLLPASTFFTSVYYKSDTKGADKILAVEEPDIGIQGDVKNTEVTEGSESSEADSFSSTTSSTVIASSMTSEDAAATNELSLIGSWSRCEPLPTHIFDGSSIETETDLTSFFMEPNYIRFDQIGTYTIGEGSLQRVSILSGEIDDALFAVEGTFTITALEPLTGTFEFTRIEGNELQYSGELSGSFEVWEEADGELSVSGTLGLEEVTFSGANVEYRSYSYSNHEIWEFTSSGGNYTLKQYTGQSCSDWQLFETTVNFTADFEDSTLIDEQWVKEMALTVDQQSLNYSRDLSRVTFNNHCDYGVQAGVDNIITGEEDCFPLFTYPSNRALYNVFRIDQDFLYLEEAFGKTSSYPESFGKDRAFSRE